MPAYTSAASAICGTHFGLTKLVASTVRRPQSDRRSISAILSAVATGADSFCRPSRGPTSTMRTAGSLMGGRAHEAHLAPGEQVVVAQRLRVDRRAHAHRHRAIAVAPDLALDLAVDDAVRELPGFGLAQFQLAAGGAVLHQHDVAGDEVGRFLGLAGRAIGQRHARLGPSRIHPGIGGTAVAADVQRRRLALEVAVLL